MLRCQLTRLKWGKPKSTMQKRRKLQETAMMVKVKDWQEQNKQDSRRKWADELNQSDLFLFRDAPANRIERDAELINIEYVEKRKLLNSSV